MELYKDVLVRILEKEVVSVIFPNINIDINELAALACYDALQKIKAIIENDDLSDFECVEMIVCVLEDIGSDGGFRHDF